MHVSLTKELESRVKAKVESGLYNNASEVIREALRFMDTHEDWIHEVKLARLREQLKVGTEGKLDAKIKRERLILGDLPELSVQILEIAREHGRVTINDIETTTGVSRGTIKGHVKSLHIENVTQRCPWRIRNSSGNWQFK